MSNMQSALPKIGPLTFCPKNAELLRTTTYPADLQKGCLPVWQTEEDTLLLVLRTIWRRMEHSHPDYRNAYSLYRQIWTDDFPAYLTTGRESFSTEMLFSLTGAATEFWIFSKT